MRDSSRTTAAARDRDTGWPAGWGLGTLGCIVALLAPFVALTAPRSDVVAVVGSPGEGMADLARVVAAADGAILGAGGSDNVIIARSDRTGFAARLYAAGARLVLDAARAEGCVPPAGRAIPANSEGRSRT